MIDRELLIAGMFRSGTTLLARMLSDHPQALVVSDPFVYFFKHYRNQHLASIDATDWHADEPTPDYFLGERADLLNSLMSADLGEAIPASTLEALRSDILNWKTAQHPELCDRLSEVQGKSFADVYASLMALATDIYGDAAVTMAGTKVSWCEEFLPALARAFPNMRFVMPVRDLRAIVASQNSQRGIGEGKRPLLFYVRHWRKSIALAHHYAYDHPELKERVTLVRYEDLVAEPEQSMQRLQTHLGLPAAPLTVGAKSKGWSHNSSFSQMESGISTASTERWRTVLRDSEIQALEAMAGPELLLMGYSLDQPRRKPSDCLDTDCEPSFDEISPWLQPFLSTSYIQDSERRKAEYAAEDRRLAEVESKQATDQALEQQLFLVKDFLPRLRQAWQA